MDADAFRHRAAEILRELDALAIDAQSGPAEIEKLDLLAGRARAELAGAARGIGPDARDQAAQVFRRLAMAESWTDRRPLRGPEWMQAAADLAVSPELRATLAAERARLDETPLLDEIAPLLKARKVAQARRRLQELRDLAGSPAERERIDALLDEPRTLALPIHGPPSLTTLNGLGSMLYGRRAPRPDGTYVATLYFVVLFIPLIPLAAYVVRSVSPGWQFFAKVPLTPFQIAWRRILLGVPLLLLGSTWAFHAWETSSWRIERAALSDAETALARDDGGAALAALAAVRHSRHPERRARADALGPQAVAKTLAGLRGPGDVRRFLDVQARHVLPAWARPEDVERVALDVAPQPGGGAEVADFLRWALKGIVPKELARKAASRADDPELDVLALDGPALDRMERRLRAGPFKGWEDHALAFINAVEAERARPILHPLAERFWKGQEAVGRLARVKALPAPLDALRKADEERDLEAKAKALEALAALEGLPEPQAGWHRLGTARRLRAVYASLYRDEDARAWTLKAHALAPDDPELRVGAIRAWVEEGDYAKAVALGESAAADPRILVWLGVAYARSGRPADAARVLRPYVAANLETYLSNMESWIERDRSHSDRLYASLSNGTSEHSIRERLARLPQAQAQQEADRWVREKLAGDPHLKKYEAGWRPVEAAYPAALELAMAELALAEAGDDRPARLKEAERLFLQLRRVSEDPHQELQLGQVYFWLGKPAEGQAIFSKLEKAGDGELLLRLGSIYRDLGRSADARRVLEAAYGALQGELRYAAALRRSYAWKSLEDRRDWLRKCDGKSSMIRMELAQVEGEIHLRDGRYKEAALELRRVAAHHAALPENERSNNNAALLELDLARATGEAEHLAAARALLRKAVEKDPQDGIVLNNYVDALAYLGYRTLSRDALDVKVLHQLPNVGWLSWRTPQPSAEAWAAEARAQAEFRQSAEIGARGFTLSPDNLTGLYAQLNYGWLSGDAAGVRALRESVEARSAEHPAQVDAADPDKATPPQTETPPVWGPRVEAARGGPPASLAYLLTRHAEEIYDKEPEAALRAVEEARRLQDCPATRNVLLKLRLRHALLAFTRKDPAYKSWDDELKNLSREATLDVYLDRHPDKASDFRAMEEFGPLLAAAEDHADLPSPFSNFRLWRALRLVGSPRAAAIRDLLLRTSIQLDALLIQWAVSGGEAELLDAWQAAKLYGDQATVDRLVAEARRRKLLSQLFSE